MAESLYWTIEWTCGKVVHQEFLVCSEELALESYASKLLKEPDLKDIALYETDFYADPIRRVESYTIID